ncbi:Endonuclease/exonuclease/phosphatase [Hyaloraphidium curvatum]|nr:Endonuclease/exonuclease/phosphatase [Hyaloraphidium curvatum]
MPGSTRAPLAIRVVSHNIRFVPPEAVGRPPLAHASAALHEPDWTARLPLLAKQFRFLARHPWATFLCLQEVMRHQLDALLAGLDADGDAWAAVGLGAEGGEHVPVLYRPAEFDPAWHRTLWLSETPAVPGSRGWDAKYPRVLTCAGFAHRATGRHVAVLATHLDHRGKLAREMSARMIGAVVRELSAPGQGGVLSDDPAVRAWLPADIVLVAGDLNSFEPDDRSYPTLASPSSSVRDVRTAVPEADRFGPARSWTDFPPAHTEGGSLIDFVFAGPAEGLGKAWRADGYGVVESWVDGVWCSDHRAVVADVTVL